jgi:hypothetical protein
MRYQTAVLTAALLASAGALAPGASPAAAADASGLFAPPATTAGCAIKKTEYATSTIEEQSTSKSFVNLVDAGSITFTQRKVGCVAGTFFANAGNVTSGDHMFLQVLLDGAPCTPLTGSPGYFFANSDVDFSSHAAAFFCSATVSVGTHKIQVQYASQFGGNVQIFQRTLEVTHL